MAIHPVDILILFIFILGTFLFGLSFVKKNKNVSDYTSGGGNVPGFVVGMSIFATYVSSISFLALPGNAYSSNWNSLVFSISIPLAIIIAAKYFVPFYRNISSISAYSFLEEKFGYWARAYTAVCYLLTQIARIGSVLFLLALALNSMLGWSIPLIIVITGVIVVIYSTLGGIKAVLWNDAVQATILIFGAIVCAIILIVSLPGGFNQFISVGKEFDKFSLGSLGTELNMPTFWVTLIYGLFINLQNFGIDQNYIQRYKSAKNDKSARSSALFGGLLYLPVSFLFFVIGTALFVYYKSQPEILPEGIASDQVFPYFIVHGLPVGVTGMLIASIFAAGMSTLSTSINSSATIILTDFFEHKRKKPLTEKSRMKILYSISLLVGILGIGIGLAMMSVQSALDAWWSMASVFSGGMLGLFLLGYFSIRSKTIKSSHALFGVIAGVLFISWLSLSGQTILHNYLAVVLGTIIIFIIGFLARFVFPKKQKSI
ncbi:MAG: sodium:solute symporter [Fermentimonas sp.]|nr:sodium:solute symporter [Fermentimonas sp.]